jgi:nucleoside-diphosphate-sugar epimerase
MRNLITGGAGFIGSHLADRLVEGGEEVVILDDLSTGARENVEHLLSGPGVELVEGSVLDQPLVEELVGGADRCFHLASAVGVKLVVEEPLNSVLSSVRGADIVIGAAAREGVPLLFTSTSEIYGKIGGHPLREDSDRLLGPPTTWRWSYSTAKAFGEIIAVRYCRERGAPTVVSRLFNTVGERQTDAYGMVLPTFVRQALAGEPLTVHGDGTQSRCFTHVADAVEALVGLIDTEEAYGKVFNVGSREEITINSLAEMVIGRSGSEARVRHDSHEDRYPDGFEEVVGRVPDCSAIAQLTGWTPRRALTEAIDDVIAYERRSNRRALIAS